MKAIFIFIIMLAIAGAVFAATGYINTFTTGVSEINITFEDNTSETLYIDIPRYVYITSFKLNITGYPNATRTY